METLWRRCPLLFSPLNLMPTCWHGLHFISSRFVDQHERTDGVSQTLHLIYRLRIQSNAQCGEDWQKCFTGNIKRNLAVIDIGIFNVDQTKNVCALPFKVVVSTLSATVCSTVWSASANISRLTRLAQELVEFHGWPWSNFRLDKAKIKHRMVTK